MIKDGVSSQGSVQCFKAEPADVGKRLDLWLVQCMGASRSRVQALIHGGAVAIEGGAVCVSPKESVRDDACYHVSIPDPVPAEPQPQPIALDVVYEDGDIIVLNKAAGIVVHPAAGHADGTLVNALLHHCKDLQGIGGTLRPGIVHRLDKDTSGLLVVAKHQAAMEGLAGQFQSRTVEKTYLAITAGIPFPLQGRIETQIGRSRHDRKKMSTRPVATGKHAVSFYRVLAISDPFAVVEVGIETGRTHQIRVHLAHMGTPVAGDAVYGASRSRLWSVDAPDIRQMLHAYRICFAHPVTGVPCRFTAPLPEDMQTFAQHRGLELPSG